MKTSHVIAMIKQLHERFFMVHDKEKFAKRTFSCLYSSKDCLILYLISGSISLCFYTRELSQENAILKHEITLENAS